VVGVSNIIQQTENKYTGVSTTTKLARQQT